MSRTGVLAPEGGPQVERPISPYPFVVGEHDHSLDSLADQQGVAGYYMMDIEGGVEPNQFDQSATTFASTVTTEIVGTEAVEQSTSTIPEKTVAKAYFMGSIAVEAAGFSRASHLPGEAQTRERYQRFLTGVAMHNSVARTPDAPKTVHRSSLDLLRSAAAGNQESRKALLLDAQTHVSEIVGDVGEGMEVELDINDQFQVVWDGQTNEARQFHTLTSYPNQARLIRDAVHAEGLLGFRIEDRTRDGQLSGRALFDTSAIPEAAREALASWGYFLDTVSFAIRKNQVVGSKLRINSLFAGGVDERLLPPRHSNETEADEIARQQIALDNRFDLKVARRMRALLLQEAVRDEMPAEMLEDALVAPEGFDELDMAMLYDVLAAEEVAGEAKTFFGSVKLWQELGSPQLLTREHYEAHIAARKRRQAEQQALCEAIVSEQIRRCAQATTPREAAELKRRVVLDMVVERATQDRRIDETRLGRVAAGLINQARERYEAGDQAGGDKFKNTAKEKATDPSCPPGERNKALDTSDEEKKPDHDCNEVKDGAKVHCPYCDQDVKAIVPKKGGRIYCSNKRCTQAYQKENLAEKALERKKNNAPKQAAFNPFASSKPSNKKPQNKGSY